LYFRLQAIRTRKTTAAAPFRRATLEPQSSCTEGSKRVEFLSFYQDVNTRNFPKHRTLNELGRWKMTKIIVITEMVLLINHEGEIMKGSSVTSPAGYVEL
jgi:hypothetical protein